MPYIPQGRPRPNFPLGIAILNESYSELSGIHKYGFNADIDTSYELVWEKGGAVTLPTGAGTASINSASGNSGCKIMIEGLDENYAEVTEELTLDASGDATSTTLFLRINRAFNSGSTDLSGDVDIVVGGNTIAFVSSGHQNTLQMVYTVPAGKTAYLIQLTGGVSEKEKNVEMRVRGKAESGVYRTRDYIAFQTSFFHKGYQIPVKFTEKTDIQVDAKCVGNASISASFDIILEDN